VASAPEYAWRSAVLRVTLVIAAITAGLVLVDALWSAASYELTPTVLFGAFLALADTLRRATSSFRRLVLVVAVGLPVALGVGLVIDQIWPLRTQPHWTYYLSAAGAAWTGCLACIGLVQLSARRSKGQSSDRPVNPVEDGITRRRSPSRK
jgi:hypothetical protein